MLSMADSWGQSLGTAPPPQSALPLGGDAPGPTYSLSQMLRFAAPQGDAGSPAPAPVGSPSPAPVASGAPAPIGSPAPSQFLSGLSSARSISGIGSPILGSASRYVGGIESDAVESLVAAGVPRDMTTSYAKLASYMNDPNSVDTESITKATGLTTDDIKNNADTSGYLAQGGRYLGAAASLADIPLSIMSNQPDVAKGLRTARDVSGAFSSLSRTALGASTGLSDVASLSLPGLEAGEGLLGSAFGTVGEVAGGIGAVAGIGLGALELSQGKLYSGTLDVAVSAATIAMLAGTVTAPFAWIPAVLGAVGHLIMGMLGTETPDLTHDQRENLDLQKKSGQASQFLSTLHGSQSPDDLYKNLVSQQSGYVGGTSALAIAVGNSFTKTAGEVAKMVQDGELLLPSGKTFQQTFGVDPVNDAARPVNVGASVGNLNPQYPVMTQKGFYKAIENDPASLFVSTQAGISQDKLAQLNAPMRQQILAAAKQFTTLQPIVDEINARMPKGQRVTQGDLVSASQAARVSGVGFSDPRFLSLVKTAMKNRVGPQISQSVTADLQAGKISPAMAFLQLTDAGVDPSQAFGSAGFQMPSFNLPKVA